MYESEMWETGRKRVYLLLSGGQYSRESVVMGR